MNKKLGKWKMANNISSNETCFYTPADFLVEKFILITIFGSTVCAIGAVNNALLLYLLTRRSSASSHIFYLVVLAGCDIIVEIAYILLMSAQILYDYMENLTLYYAWNNYLKPVFAISHVAMTVSTYMIVAASAERYLTSITWFKGSCLASERLLAVIVIVCFSVLSKGMVYWELDVVYSPNCSGFESYHVRMSALATYPGPYRYVYMLWFRHMVHVFVPFALLIILNVGILVRLRRAPAENQSNLLGGERRRERKRRVKAATRMLIAMVTTYLVSNLLNVVITLWEHLDLDSLRDQNGFYAFSADTVSLLTVITSAIRLPIYCACNKQLRQDLRRLFDTKLCPITKAKDELRLN